MRVIITGVTGMVGEGVLHECLLHEDVEHVLVLSRKPCGISHPKLQEIIQSDFFDLSEIEDQLTDYDACFFCLGVSSFGMKEAEYARITYDLTLYIANLLVKQNNAMVFCYVSGAGTDSSEKGRSMWARVKGKTENDLLQLSFRATYLFRAGYMQPTQGLNNTKQWYYLFTWMYPALQRIFPAYVSTLREVGLAMIHSVQRGYPTSILEVEDIVKLAKE
jgi:uncharacterized protein YbjT (DUF2867 family)